MKRKKTNIFSVIGFVLLVVLNLGALFISFSEVSLNRIQVKITSWWGKAQGQKVLSVIYGDLQNDGTQVKVAKIRTIEGIILEFYSISETGVKNIISRVLLPNMQNGYYTHRGRSIQLAIVDVDGDGKMELLSPTFDKYMVARLNPYHYSEKQGGFIPFFFRSDVDE